MEVTDQHVINYEVERDLIPLILSNCQYSVEKGKEALEEFDLEKIQQQIVSRFLRGKPLITLTVGKSRFMLLFGFPDACEIRLSTYRASISRSTD